MRPEMPAARPWHREPWPWLLMSGPAIVVVAGFVTLYLAVSGQDGLVVDDYYKQGKTINQSLHRDEVARRMGLTASASLDQVNDRMVVVLARRDGQVLPATLTISLVHATRSGMDKSVVLTAGNGGYAGILPPLGAGKWNVLIEDAQKQWRLQQQIVVGATPVPLLQFTPAN